MCGTNWKAFKSQIPGIIKESYTAINGRTIFLITSVDKIIPDEACRVWVDFVNTSDQKNRFFISSGVRFFFLLFLILKNPSKRFGTATFHISTSSGVTCVWIYYSMHINEEPQKRQFAFAIKNSTIKTSFKINLR